MANSESKSEVSEFYKNAKIFITGGTGFLGKVLISKLLQSCQHLDCIYLLVRTKKDKDPQSRITELFEEVIFEPLKRKNPDLIKKLICIPGDVSCLKLGISDEDYELLTREVTHVIHAAATVRFNEKMKSALKINVLGTCEILNFCNKCTQLKVFVYVSTAYVHTYKDVTTEKTKEPPLSRKHALNILDALSEEQLNLLTPSLIKLWPNTYAFTKAIAESCVIEMAKDYPVVIFRPAVVTGSIKEPLEGWIDNLYGPSGMVVGAGVGLLRVACGDANVVMNLVPVDMSVNALLCSAWETNKEYYKDSNKNLQHLDNLKAKASPKIYNFVSKTNGISIKSYMEKGFKIGLKYPVTQCIWYYSFTITKSKLLFQILSVLFHFVPAFLMDLGLLLIGKKRQFVKIYKKIYEFTDLLTDFTSHQRQFTNENIINLWNSLKEIDKKIFFFDLDTVNWDKYMEITFVGMRLYLLKENESTLPQARRKLFYLWLAHRTLQITLVGLFFWLINKYIYTFSLPENIFIKASLMPKESLS